jgi:hypothetical protein
MEFDLGLFQEEEPCAIINDVHEANANVAAHKTLEQQMEEDKIGLLTSNSDLQAFMDIGTLPEIKGDEDVENVMNEVEKFIQQYDNEDKPTEEEVLPPEEMTAAEDLLDELLKSEDLKLDLDNLEFDFDEETAVEEPPVAKREEEQVIQVDEEFENNFIDLTNVTKIVKDGQEIYIMIAPPSPVMSEVAQPQSMATSFTSDDSDWSPDSPKANKGRPMVKRSPKSKSRKSPYIKDKKERKKQQNVEAARRYRDKKKAEQNVAEEVEHVLLAKNTRLKKEVNELEAEIKTMKKLMVELGLVKA